jgi:hypothetical protein
MGLTRVLSGGLPAPTVIIDHVRSRADERPTTSTADHDGHGRQRKPDGDRKGEED